MINAKKRLKVYKKAKEYLEAETMPPYGMWCLIDAAFLDLYKKSYIAWTGNMEEFTEFWAIKPYYYSQFILWWIEADKEIRLKKFDEIIEGMENAKCKNARKDQ